MYNLVENFDILTALPSVPEKKTSFLKGTDYEILKCLFCDIWNLLNIDINSTVSISKFLHLNKYTYSSNFCLNWNPIKSFYFIPLKMSQFVQMIRQF